MFLTGENFGWNSMSVLMILAVVVVFLVAVEVGMRSLFGFGSPLVYISDQQIGYLLAPNQRTRRFGNWIEINEYSMRSASTTKTRSPSTLRVLLMGDSVANGGWWTDQNQTIAAMMTQILQSSTQNSKLKTQNFLPPSPPVEILNASANSWGPRNELAYLQRFGTFEAQATVLLINTDDLFATAPTALPVGRDRNYPDHKPLFALVEVFSRYVLPAKPVPELQAVYDEPGDRVGFNLEAIQQIQALAHEANSQFLLAMTPLLREIGQPGPRDYEQQARQRLIDFTAAQQITYLDFLPLFNAVEPATLYRDHIHLSPQGNHKVSEVISQSLQQQII